MPAYRRKLIEVDLPLDDINSESAREKSIRHGHPSTLHMWWARRPLAACRAVIFASLVDDPSSCPDEFPTEEKQHAERERLHDLIRRLVKWESTDESRPESRELIAQARYEIARSVARSRDELEIFNAMTQGRESAKGTEKTHSVSAPSRLSVESNDAILRYLNDNALPIYDPFAGGGSIPLEAQRLGLRAVASDLNPVAVLINKALIELPPKFANRPPVNPAADRGGMFTGKYKGRGKNRKPEQVPWRGAGGLADDIRYYGRWMREKAFERIGHLYPKAKLADGGEATVIAWLWARTVPCPNPACGVQMPLMRTFQVSRKANNRHWIKPIVDNDSKSVSFEVQDHDTGVPTTGTVNRNGATCIVCNAAAPLSYVREQARAGNMGEQMTAIVAEGDRRRLFLSPNKKQVRAALEAEPEWKPIGRLPEQALGFRVQRYGFVEWHQLFTERQLIAMTTLSDLVLEVRTRLSKQGASTPYIDAVCTYLALAIGRVASSHNSFTWWQNLGDKIAQVFSRQAISMIWDFSEGNIFSNSTQNWMAQVEWVAEVVERLPFHANVGKVHQVDASTTIHSKDGPVIVTDPPYYDNIGYADLSDFFYAWLRPMLRGTYPSLFSGMVTPKSEEMIATPFRFENSRDRFEVLLKKTLQLIRKRSSPDFPSSIFYAYKQHEEERDGKSSTGWETMLSALVESGFRVVGTWPIRTERQGRPRSFGSNALASSVVLVCRTRSSDAPAATRRQFVDTLEKDLPAALDHLTRESHIAPVDLAQAAIGPGMEIYSQFSRVETLSGERVSVRDALVQINRVIAEYHQREQGELDPESQFCVAWLRQHGYSVGDYGEAEVLSQAMNVSVDGLASRRLLTAERGIVALLPLDEYGPDRQPPLGEMTAWEGCFRIAYHLNREYGHGIQGAAEIVQSMGSAAESVERLARILYDHYDSAGDSPNAVIFNSLVTSWQDIQVQAQQIHGERQGALV